MRTNHSRFQTSGTFLVGVIAVIIIFMVSSQSLRPGHTSSPCTKNLNFNNFGFHVTFEQTHQISSRSIKISEEEKTSKSIRIALPSKMADFLFVLEHELNRVLCRFSEILQVYQFPYLYDKVL